MTLLDPWAGDVPPEPVPPPEPPPGPPLAPEEPLPDAPLPQQTWADEPVEVPPPLEGKREDVTPGV